MLGRLRFAGVSGGLGAGGGSPAAATPSQGRFWEGLRHQPRSRRFPKPVPGRLRRPDGPSGRPRPAHNRFRAGGFQKRRNQRRPQRAPGGKTAPKPTPVARITFNRETTGARNRFWAPGRPSPEARSPHPSRQKGRGRATRPPPGPGQPASFGQTASYSQQQSSPRA